MKIKLLGNRILIEVKEEETKTESGLIVPPNKDRGDVQVGVAIEVGSGKVEEGVLVKMEVRKGDNILFQYGAPVSIEGKSYILATEEDVIAIV